MSSTDKIDLLDTARSFDFRTYLYFVATEDPEINIARVKQRVALGGHDVPVDKIVARYARSLQLLPAAIERTHRAFFFDTTELEPRYIGTITAGDSLQLATDEIPNWFETIWKKHR